MSGSTRAMGLWLRNISLEKDAGIGKKRGGGGWGFIQEEMQPSSQGCCAYPEVQWDERGGFKRKRFIRSGNAIKVLRNRTGKKEQRTKGGERGDGILILRGVSGGMT